MSKYESGIKVSIGKSQDVSLPPEVKHGRACCMHFDTDKAFLLPPSVPDSTNRRVPAASETASRRIVTRLVRPLIST